MEPGQHACNARQHQTQLGSPGQGTLPTQPARHHAHDDHAQQHQRQILRGRNALHTLPQATQPRVHHPAMVQTQGLALRSMVGAQLRIQRLSLLHLSAPGLGAHRHIATRLAAVHDGRDVGTHPVKAAVFAPVFHQPCPGVAAPDGGPHVLVGLGRHVGVANQVVGLANQLVIGIAAGVHKRCIAVGDDALGVRAGNQHALRGVIVFIVRHRQVDSHRQSLFI